MMTCDVASQLSRMKGPFWVTCSDGGRRSWKCSAIETVQDSGYFYGWLVQDSESGAWHFIGEHALVCIKSQIDRPKAES